MELADKHVVVTGGGNGIGRALCRRFAAEGARAIVVADLDGDNATAVAEEIGGTAVRLDVSEEQEVVGLVESAIDANGPIDLFCANAGIITTGGLDDSNETWDRIIGVNLLAHVYAARALIPGFVALGAVYLLHTAAAAGVLAGS